MLSLRGIVTETNALNDTGHHRVIRFSNPECASVSLNDVALIKSDQDAAKLDKNHRSLFFIGRSDYPDIDKNKYEYFIANDTFSYFEVGDIIGYEPQSNKFRSLYRSSSKHNSFFVTERCNHYCLMCSQPPKNVDDGWLIDEIIEALPLVKPETKSFAFTGGEPLLEEKKFIRALAICKEFLPNTAIQVLTNGRAFSRTTTADAWAGVSHPNLTAAIPIYSAIDHIHDYVVQSKGALNESILGILNLKERSQKVEIRIVLHALTAPRVFETIKWIARNLPFVDHVALMGLENTGFALANDDVLDIDPADYMDVLEAAVKYLSSEGINVSIYNLPICVIPPSIRKFSVQSISDWKQGYLDECVYCIEQSNCAGFFQTGKLKISRAIKPISK
jgi:His-Xaa-Ser system radical SAM maturase HxsC